MHTSGAFRTKNGGAAMKENLVHHRVGEAYQVKVSSLQSLTEVPGISSVRV